MYQINKGTIIQIYLIFCLHLLLKSVLREVGLNKKTEPKCKEKIKTYKNCLLIFVPSSLSLSLFPFNQH
jgi:hypothetical protein